MSKVRGFEHVEVAHKKYAKEVAVHGQKQTFFPNVILPTRGDAGSAGYDFYAPVDFKINPRDEYLLWTNVKAYMGEREVLQIFPRSSVAIKRGVTIKNTVGIIDASYYSNDMNDGNIGLCLINDTGVTVEFKAGERVAQGIFIPFLVADEDETTSSKRSGGFGSTGK